MCVLIETPTTRLAKRRYILSVLFGDWLGLDWRHYPSDRTDVRISLVQGPAEGLRLPDTLFSLAQADWLQPVSLPLANDPALPMLAPEYAEGAPLPMLYGANAPAPGDLGDDRWIAGDLLGGVFFLLTRYEEIAAPATDPHGRFPAQASVMGQAGLMGQPLADRYAARLHAELARLAPALPAIPAPPPVRISHDVDHPFAVAGRPVGRALRGVVGDLVRRRSPRTAAARVGALCLPEPWRGRLDPFNRIDWLMDASERRGLRSTFNMMAASPGPFDNGYDPAHPRIQTLLRRIDERGHRIGFHPSYRTMDDPECMARELAHLRAAAERAGVRQPIETGRHHYLRWQAGRSWEAWADLGLRADASVGFAEQPGFRCGTARPFRVWSLARGEALDLFEEPLILMDVSATERGGGAVADQAEALAATAHRYGGAMDVLWHNDGVATPAQQRLYAGVLDRIVEQAG